MCAHEQTSRVSLPNRLGKRYFKHTVLGKICLCLNQATMDCKYLRGLKSEPLWGGTTFQRRRGELWRAVLGKHKASTHLKAGTPGTEAGKAIQSQTLDE